MELLQAYLPEDRRASLAQGIPLPEWTRGTVLFADISGFTPLTEEVTRTLGIRRGTEELTRQLNRIYDAILAPVEQYGGTVITFSGDAVLCFFADTVTADGRWWTDDGGQDDGGQDDPAPTSAVGGLSCALAMQTAMRQFDAVPLPDGNTAHITLKVALATGPVRRMVVGDPTIRRIDTLAGATVTRVARGEEICSHDEIWIDTATAEELGEQVEILEWREEETTHERFGRVGSFSASVEPIENFSNVELTPEQLKQWLHPIVYDWIADQEGEFLTELRPVVALFTRFTGFDFDRDAEVGEKFDRFIVRVQQILAYYHGALLELTIGDKGSYFYAAFGAPIVHEDDAPRAVHAALDLVALCEEVGLKQPPQIGISQGTMRVGAYGSTTRRTYGAQGDEVNLAARLMMHAEAGQVLVSGRISSAVANEFDLEPLPPIRLKGKAEPLLPFVVKGPRTNRPHEPHYALPMIGRERELGQIQDLLERVRHGEGQIVGVTAPAGMGKSRLIGEVVLNARRRGDATWIGESQSFGSNTSYLVWVSIWRAFFDVNPQMPTRRLLRALEGELQDRAPERVDLLPLLGAALQLALPENEFTAALEPEFRKSALQALLVECVRSAAEEAREQNRVLLFVLEDVHWIDPASLDLLARLAGSIAALPVLILLSYRPQEPDSVGAIRDSRRRDESPLRDALPNFTEIVLNELSLEQGEALIRAKLAQFAPETTAPVPAPLIAQITQRAQGNPFYIEELLNYMHDRGLNLRDSAAYTHADLPNSLYRLILSRIDHLAEHQQLTLKVASILGRTFRLAHLAGYYPRLGDAATVHTELTRLTQTNILLQSLDSARDGDSARDAAEPELIYLFKHIITQQVAYDSLAESTRAMLHEAYARFLEMQTDPAQTLDLIAYHYDHSENLDKRREFLGRAGEAAAARYANVEAVDYLTRALALTPSEQLAARCELLTTRERVYDVQGARDLQRADLAELEQLAIALNEPETRAQSLLRQGWLAQRIGGYSQSLALAQTTIEFVKTAALDEPTRQKLWADAYALWGEIVWAQGDALGARPYVERSLELARACRDRAAEARALDRLGSLYYYLDEPLQARPYHQQALGLARGFNDRRREWTSLNSLGAVANSLRAYPDALALFADALAIVREIGDRRGESILLSNLAVTHQNLSEYDEAIAYAEQAQSVAQAISDRNSVRRTLANLGEMYRLLGEYAQAEEYAQRALELARELGNRLGEEIALGNLGTIALAQGDAVTALHLLGEALTLARAIQARESQALLLTASGEAYLLQGELAPAQEVFSEALNLWQTLALSSEMLRARAGLGAVALRQHDLNLARQQIEPILNYLQAHPEQIGDPAALTASFTVYEILRASKDSRARPVIQAAQTALQARAEKIQDPAHRRSFLEKIRIHQNILSASNDFA